MNLNRYEIYLNNCFYIFEKNFAKLDKLEKESAEYKELKKNLMEFQEKFFPRFEYFARKFYFEVINNPQISCEPEMCDFQKTLSIIETVKKIPHGKIFIERSLSLGILKITRP